jgi:hypothetical protein
MVGDATLSPDGRYAATADFSGHTVVWNVGALGQVSRLAGAERANSGHGAADGGGD